LPYYGCIIKTKKLERWKSYKASELDLITTNGNNDIAFLLFVVAKIY
jgi:hypothetical protein